MYGWYTQYVVQRMIEYFTVEWRCVSSLFPDIVPTSLASVSSPTFRKVLSKPLEEVGLITHVVLVPVEFCSGELNSTSPDCLSGRKTHTLKKLEGRNSVRVLLSCF